MQKLFLGICFTIMSFIVSAQQLKLRIVDASSSEAISSATIEIRKFGKFISDERGVWEMRSLPAGSLRVVISAVGYTSFEGSLQSSSDWQEIRLERINLFMAPVEISAVRASDRAPFAKTNLRKAEIAQNNLGQDLPFLLNQTPSVIINSDAGNGIGYTGIRIRGSDATRINMTINGIPYNDSESQGLFFVNLPDLASSVDQIQIQRGVGTSSNGAGAFGASINFSTNEVRTDAYGEINNSVGSFNTFKHTVKAGTGLLGNHFTIDARVSKISSDGYIDRAFTDLNSVYLSGAYLSENSSLRFNLMSGKEKTYQAWNGIPEADLIYNRKKNYSGTDRPGAPYENETDNYQQDHYQLFFNHQFNSKLRLTTAAFLTRGRGYYEQYKAAEDYADYGLPDFIFGTDTAYSTDLIRQLWLDNHFYGQTFSVQYLDELQELNIGGGWNQYKGDHYGKIIWAEKGISDNQRWYDNPARKRDISAFVKYQRKIFGNFSLFGDLQLRNITYSLNGFRDNPNISLENKWTFINPKFGAMYSRGKHQIFASYAQANKEPNRDDFEAGANNQPRPEQLHDLEFGWELKDGRYNFGATLYYMLYKDQLVLTGQINDVGAYTRTNIAESFRAGIELQAGARFTSWLSAQGNLTLSRNRIMDFTEYYDDYDHGGQIEQTHGNTDIAYSPAVTAAASISLTPVKNLQLSLPAKYVSRQYLDNTSNRERSLNPFYVQDFRASYSIPAELFRSVTIIGQVSNLFDRKYEPNGYTFSYRYGSELITENFFFPMAGRNFMIGFNIGL